MSEPLVGIISLAEHIKNHTRMLERSGFRVECLGNVPRGIPPRIDVVVCRTMGCSHRATNVALDEQRNGTRAVLFCDGATETLDAVKAWWEQEKLRRKANTPEDVPAEPFNALDKGKLQEALGEVDETPAPAPIPASPPLPPAEGLSQTQLIQEVVEEGGFLCQRLLHPSVGVEGLLQHFESSGVIRSSSRLLDLLTALEPRMTEVSRLNSVKATLSALRRRVGKDGPMAQWEAMELRLPSARHEGVMPMSFILLRAGLSEEQKQRICDVVRQAAGTMEGIAPEVPPDAPETEVPTPEMPPTPSPALAVASDSTLQPPSEDEMPPENTRPHGTPLRTSPSTTEDQAELQRVLGQLKAVMQRMNIVHMEVTPTGAEFRQVIEQVGRLSL